jgi:hypothetical protein
MDLTALEALFTLHDDLSKPLADLAVAQSDDGRAGAQKPDAAGDKQVKSALEKAIGIRRGVAALLEKPLGDDGSLTGLLAAVTRPFMLTDETPQRPTADTKPAREAKTPKRVVKKPPR